MRRRHGGGGTGFAEACGLFPAASKDPRLWGGGGGEMGDEREGPRESKEAGRSFAQFW
jgi:hypothetical protein